MGSYFRYVYVYVTTAVDAKPTSGDANATVGLQRQVQMFLSFRDTNTLNTHKHFLTLKVN